VDSLAGIGITSFLVGLSGALMPGPVLSITIGETAARLRAPGGRVRGALVGPQVVLGHGLLEILLVVGITLGLGTVLARESVLGAIGVVGGIVLVWMAGGMLRSLRSLSLQGGENPGARRHPVLAGILTTASNPYWTLWWATIGLGYIALSQRLGVTGLVMFYLGHIFSDLAWYSLVSGTLAAGGGLLTDRVYRGLVGACAVFLFAFGVYFGYAGARHFMV
jgi:threonine/homoserine/homoserine lactone efflux protein